MPASHDFVQLDVFTQTPLAGNPLAVFTDACGLTDKQMQALSREMNLSDFPLTYYSRQLLFSDRARESWVEPDLKHFLKDVF